MEIEDPVDGVSTPVEAKPPPSFARLTDVTDGSPLKAGHVPPEQTNETDSGEAGERGPESQLADTKARAGRHQSHEPEYNPWDN